MEAGNRCFDQRVPEELNRKIVDHLSDINMPEISGISFAKSINKEVKIIFSGNNEYPYAVREQWTDSCNLLALKEGVVLSYDRNEKTIAAFVHAGFKVSKVQDLIQDLENDRIAVADIHDTVIVMPSAELSRARGGFHCMSMPINRD